MTERYHRGIKSFRIFILKQVLVIGLSSLLAQEKISNSISDKFGTILNCIVTTLMIEQTIEEAEANRRKKNTTTTGSQIEQTIPSDDQIMINFIKK